MRHLISKDGSKEMFAFDSMAEIVNYVDPTQFKPGRTTFVGEDLPTWEHVDKRTTRCWAEGIYTIQQYIDRLTKVALPELKSHKRTTHYDAFDGDEVDMDKMQQGEAFWKTTEREETKGPTAVTICVDTTTVYAEESENILWRGAAAIALTKLLEDKGYTVELWVVNGSQLYGDKPNTKVMTSCCLKRGNELLDTSTIVNQVAGWFYRTATFTLLNTICAKTGHEVQYGYGNCYTPTAVDLDLITTDELRIYSAGVYSFEGALGVILSEITKFAAESFAENN